MAFFQDTLDSILPINQALYDVAKSNNAHVEGGAGSDKKLIMMSLIYSLDAKLVYETGFNMGQMAACICNALEVSKGRYVGFEIEENTKPVVSYLQNLFPNKIEMEYGDSAITLPNRLIRTGESPDIFFVDGNHTKAGLQIDLRNALSCVKKGGIIMVDDVDTLKPFICEVIPENQIIWFQHTDTSGPGSCIYQVK